MAPPMLRFVAGPADAEFIGWSGPWPPPSEMIYLVGKQTGLANWTERYIILEQGIPAEEIFVNCDVYSYLRATYSKLPAELDEHPHVARGAEYQFDRQLAAI